MFYKIKNPYFVIYNEIRVFFFVMNNKTNGINVINDINNIINVLTIDLQNVSIWIQLTSKT